MSLVQLAVFSMAKKAKLEQNSLANAARKLENANGKIQAIKKLLLRRLNHISVPVVTIQEVNLNMTHI